MKKIIFTETAPAPVGPYSQAVQFGQVLFCSGQIPIDPKTNEVLKGSIEEQTELVMENVGAVLKAAGLGFEDVIKTSIFITDMGNFPRINQVYAKYFPEVAPARSCVAVKELPKSVDVEIEVIAGFPN
ncbi:MAG: RidA family protein [Bdellovibrionaceae bacterium]|nr:RidA family protein [Pseudobdellovibrionaceae bacterium]